MAGLFGRGWCFLGLLLASLKFLGILLALGRFLCLAPTPLALLALGLATTLAGFGLCVCSLMLATRSVFALLLQPLLLRIGKPTPLGSLLLLSPPLLGLDKGLVLGGPPLPLGLVLLSTPAVILQGIADCGRLTWSTTSRCALV